MSGFCERDGRARKCWYRLPEAISQIGPGEEHGSNLAVMRNRCPRSCCHQHVFKLRSVPWRYHNPSRRFVATLTDLDHVQPHVNPQRPLRLLREKRFILYIQDYNDDESPLLVHHSSVSPFSLGLTESFVAHLFVTQISSLDVLVASWP